MYVAGICLSDKDPTSATLSEFGSRMKLLQGGELRRYYPLSDEARPEYEEWLRGQDGRRA